MTLGERLPELSGVSAEVSAGVSATMFVTLAAKALASTDAPELHYIDRGSDRILRELDIDPRRFGLNPSEVRAVLLRSQWFMQTVRRFLTGATSRRAMYQPRMRARREFRGTGVGGRRALHVA